MNEFELARDAALVEAFEADEAAQEAACDINLDDDYDDGLTDEQRDAVYEGEIAQELAYLRFLEDGARHGL